MRLSLLKRRQMLCFRSLENAVENADEKTQSERRNENAENAAN